MKRHVAAILLIVAVACMPGQTAGEPIYSTDFSTIGPEWSPAVQSLTPGTTAHPATAFLGELGRGTATLSLSDLASHAYLQLTFDLFLIRTWDGNGPYGGLYSIDRWKLDMDGSVLLDTSFANFHYYDEVNFPPSYQSYPDAYDLSLRHPYHTGALEAETLGYTWQFWYSGEYLPLDSVYRFTFLVPHTDDLVHFNFTSYQDQAIDDESWGLDNVSVQAVVPLPSTVGMGCMGIGCVLTLRAMRRLKGACRSRLTRRPGRGNGDIQRFCNSHDIMLL